jgi:hypothetical protein
MNPLLRLALIVGAGTAILWRALTKKEAPTDQARSRARAFISFDFDHDLVQKNLFAGQCSKHSPTPFSAEDWSSKESLPPKQWESLIFEKIGRCHMMFVLVSPTAYKASGIAKEIQMAIDQKVPLIGVYIAGAGTETPLPKGLGRDRTVPWAWKKIAAEVERVVATAANRF